MEQKVEHAEALRDVYGVTRPILLDALDGACHLTYGGYPNMTWIFNRQGKVVYKSDWTDTDSVVRMVEYLLEVHERRKNGERLSPFRVESINYRVQDNDSFNAGLERNGPRAVEEFKVAFD